MSCSCSCRQDTYRALVTYSNLLTGEIRVKIPSVFGVAQDVAISYVGRKSRNDIWVVPEIGDQIVVSSDDANMSNIFWVHTQDDNVTRNYRNYGEFLKTNTQSFVLGSPNLITFNSSVYQEGIRLVDGTKFYFDHTGVYNMSLSIQYENTASQIHDSVVWVNYNGAPYPNSATYTHIPSSHGGIPGSAVTTFNIIGETTAGGYVSFSFLSDSTSVRLASIAPTSGVLPNLGQPLSPAVILTFTQVS